MLVVVHLLEKETSLLFVTFWFSSSHRYNPKFWTIYLENSPYRENTEFQTSWAFGHETSRAVTRQADSCSHRPLGRWSPRWSPRGTPGPPAPARREPLERSQIARAPRHSGSALSTWLWSGLGWTALASELCLWSLCLFWLSRLVCQYLYRNIISFP